MARMEVMPCPFSASAHETRRAIGARRRFAARPLVLAFALLGLFLPGCKRLRRTDTRPLDQAGMWFRSIEELRVLEITDAEVAELAKVRQAGVSDAGCIELVRIARGRKQAFSRGDAIADLRRVGVSEPTVLELARLDQLGLWTGEAQAMRLAGMSDQVVLAVARRRAVGQAVSSGSSLAQLKDAGMNESQLLDLIQRGTTDQQAQEMIEAHRRAVSSTGFVHYSRRRRR